MKSPEMPRLSVALVTRNRPDSLRQTLVSLQNQDVQPWEVVVSDDSSQPFARENQKIAQEFGCRYTAGPQQGLYANRNHAVSVCTGTHIRTMDDDHRFPPGHISACLDALKKDPECIWTIGEHQPGRPEFLPPTQLNVKGIGEVPENFDDCWALADGSTIFPSTVFEHGHYYFDHFKFGLTYLEFGSRLHWLGYRIRVLESTYVLHLAEESSYTDPALFISTGCFSSLAHCFMYQPTAMNRLLSIAKLFKQPVAHGQMGAQAVRTALQRFGVLRKRLRQGLAVTVHGPFNRVESAQKDAPRLVDP